MFRSITKTAAVLAVGLPLAHAFDYVRFPLEVTAGKGTTLTVVNDIADGSESFDAGFDSYRVYLATTPPGWGTGPVCYLVNSTTIDTTTLTITIPADVGPSGSFYSISTMEFNQDPYKDGPSGFEYSGTFDLEGGKGEWSSSELAGFGLGDMDSVPCTAYNCIRQCNNGIDPTSDDKAIYKKVYECMLNCPGVSLPSWDELNSDDDSDFSSSSSSDDYGIASQSVSSSSGSSPTTLSTSKASAPATTSGTTTATASSSSSPSPSRASQSVSASVATNATSTSSTVPTETPNGGSQISAGIPLLFTLIAGILLM
ncbi:hypothetical protein B7463_g571, partial [Scytalidium lignicola]